MKDPADKDTQDALPGRPGRPRLNDLAPLTNAERQKRYRDSQKERVEVKIYLDRKIHNQLKRAAKRSQIALSELIVSVLAKIK
ncbi:MAG: hypothetical protein RRB22_13175 [Gammaproteobacteria bacterium]|nr:hypothetical protein [Gammaproteobacteria bacterium]